MEFFEETPALGSFQPGGQELTHELFSLQGCVHLITRKPCKTSLRRQHISGLAPYSFETLEDVVSSEMPMLIIEQGVYQGVHFTVAAEHLDWLLEKIKAWFANRDEVILVATGKSNKADLGFIILEWEYCQIDPLFLAILDDEEMVEDYSVYARSQEVE